MSDNINLKGTNEDGLVESFWAKPLTTEEAQERAVREERFEDAIAMKGKTIAEVRNILSLLDYTFLDLVEYNSENKVVKLIERRSKPTFCMKYDVSIGRKGASEIAKHIEDAGIWAEGVIPGVMAIAVPSDMDDTEVLGILSTTPHDLWSLGSTRTGNLDHDNDNEGVEE